MLPRLHASARKHFERDRLTDEAVLYAYEHALNSRPLDDEDDPRRWLVVGIDQSGRFGRGYSGLSRVGGPLVFHGARLVKHWCWLVALFFFPGVGVVDDEVG